MSSESRKTWHALSSDAPYERDVIVRGRSRTFVYPAGSKHNVEFMGHLYGALCLTYSPNAVAVGVEARPQAGATVYLTKNVSQLTADDARKVAALLVAAADAVEAEPDTYTPAALRAAFPRGDYQSYEERGVFPEVLS